MMGFHRSRISLPPGAAKELPIYPTTLLRLSGHDMQSSCLRNSVTKFDIRPPSRHVRCYCDFLRPSRLCNNGRLVRQTGRIEDLTVDPPEPQPSPEFLA